MAPQFDPTRPVQTIGTNELTEDEMALKVFLLTVVTPMFAEIVPLDRMAALYAQTAGDFLANKAGTSQIQLDKLVDQASDLMREHAGLALQALMATGAR